MRQFHRLSDAETEIMGVIWTLDAPVTAAQLLDRFAHKGWKIQTMSTFLPRLVDKGVLAQGKRGKSNTYSPAVTEAEYHSLEAQHVIDSMYNGSLRDFLAAFSGGSALKQSEVDELKQWFEEVAGHD